MKTRLICLFVITLFLFDSIPSVKPSIVGNNFYSIVCGYITDSETNEPISNANVCLGEKISDTNYSTNMTKTDTSGFYSFDVVAGQIQLTIFTGGYYGHGTSYFNIAENEILWINVSLVSLTEIENSLVCGYITDNATNEPVENANVTLLWSDDQGNFSVNSTVNGALGFYSMNIAAGKFYLIISADGYYNKCTLGNNGSYYYMGANETKWVNISLFPILQENSVVCGYVTDSFTGDPIGNAHLQLFWEDGHGHYNDNDTYSDSSGFYSMNVAAGRIKLDISADGYYTKYTNWSDIGENEVLWINVSLIRPYDPNEEFYGYVIPVNSSQESWKQENIVRLINSLLEEKITVYWLGSDTSIESINLNNENLEEKYFLKGSFVVPFSDQDIVNDDINEQVDLYCNQYGVEGYKIMEPLENLNAYTLVEPKIAIYGGDAVDDSTYTYLLRNAGFSVSVCKPSKILEYLDVNKYNIIIWGGQSACGHFKYVLSDILSVKGLRVRKAVRDFVKNGGTYIGSCYGGWRAGSGYRRPIGYPLDLGYSSLLSFLPIQLNLVDSAVYRALPGGGNITVQIEDTDTPLSYGLPECISGNSYYAGPMFIKKNLGKSETKVFGTIHEAELDTWDWDFIMKQCPWWNSRLLSNETKMNMAKKWIEKSMDQPIWVTDTYGAGKVIAFGTHPEYTSRGSPSRIVYNAIYYAVSSGPYLVSIDTPSTSS